MAAKALSPLKAKPLRNPGQSVEQAIDDLVLAKVLPYYFVPAFAWVLAGVEWFATFSSMPRQPAVYTSIAVLLSAVGGARIWRIRKRIRALQLGRDGERVVGQFLDGLREDGARIFHDVPGESFNLDHVVISQHGIFVVETKTLSKKSPRATITLDGDEILVAGHRMERNPIQQVRAQVTWLRRVLEESTGKNLPVKGAVVFPGWFVERPANGQKLDVWVLEPKSLPAFIQQEPVRLEQQGVALAAFHLSRYIRTT